MTYSVAFERAFSLALLHEGGYVDDPLDAGGETKYGISKRSYPAQDIKNLTIERAKEIYNQDWWTAYNYDRLPEAVAIKVFDMAINMGAKRAHTILQKACVIRGQNIKIDGIIGGQTVAAAGRVDQDNLLLSMGVLQGDYYLRLIEAKPSQERFKHGWLARARAGVDSDTRKTLPVPVRTAI